MLDYSQDVLYYSFDLSHFCVLINYVGVCFVTLQRVVLSYIFLVVTTAIITGGSHFHFHNR